MNISLIGMMGSGKTTSGKIVAGRTNRAFIDIDFLIEEEQGMTIADIFRKLGEKEFRKMERDAVLKLLNTKNSVISTGGGLGADKNNMMNLKKMGPVIWLYASAAQTLKRIKDTEKRPLLDVDNPEEKIKILIGKRKKCYGLADVKIDTSSLTAEETAERIIKFLGEYSWQT